MDGEEKILENANGKQKTQFIPEWLKKFFETYLERDEAGLPARPDFLVAVRSLLPREADGTLVQYSLLDNVSDVEEWDENHLLKYDEESRQMSEFVSLVKDYLKTKQCTLKGPYRRLGPKYINYHLYYDFREYLNSHGFIEKMVEVICNMFKLHPALPENPLLYIRDNYGITKETELSMVRKWLRLKKRLDNLKKENTELKAKVTAIVKKNLKRNAKNKGTAKESESVSISGTIRKSVSSRRLNIYRATHSSVQIKQWDPREDYMAQDTKVPFQGAQDYQLEDITWRSWIVPRELDEYVEETTTVSEHEEVKGSSSEDDYSVKSLGSINA